MPFAESSKLAVIVVNYGSHLLLRDNLRFVSREFAAADVIVVDNFSSSSERAAVDELCRQEAWTFLPSDVNAGFGAGMNRGVALAIERGNSMFLLLNPDATIDEKGIRLLIAAAERQPMSLIAPMIVRPSGQVWFAGADLHVKYGRSRATKSRSDYPGERFEPWLSGACLLVTQQLWNRVGGFDEHYFLYWEDVDFSVRAVENGGSLLLVEEARAVHEVGGTHEREAHQTRSRAKSSIYYYYSIRNRLLFAAQHLEAADRRRWLLNCPLAAWDVLLQGGRRQFLHSLAPLWAAARGTLAGLALYIRVRFDQRKSPTPKIRGGALPND